MKTLHAKEQGIVLVSALIILTSLTLIVVTVAFRNSSNELMSANQRDSVKAMTIAESGIEAGFALVRQGYVKLRKFEIDELTPFMSSPMLTNSLSDGTYSVTTPVVEPEHIVMNSLGQARGAEREIEVILQIDPDATFKYAIVTQDDINSISGQPYIHGPYADVHSNSNVIISGNAVIEGTVSASGDVLITSDPNLGGQVGGAAEIDIPHVYPPEYRQFATHIFTPDCRVETPDGALIADLSGGAIWHGWICDVNKKWVMSESEPFGGLLDAFYYIRGNVVVSGSPEAVWHVSLVAEGYIEIAGDAFFRSWGSKLGNDTGDTAADEILFLAGNDLKINGNPLQEFVGIMATHMEVQVSGNPYLNGYIIAENGKFAPGQEVTDGQEVVDLVIKNEFNGNMNLAANGAAALGAGNPVKVTAWRELVH